MNVLSKNTGKLEGVQIITAHISDHVQAWVNALVRAGAIVDDGVGEAMEKKSFKIGVIIGPTSLLDRQAIIDICEQQLADDVTLSVRYFMLADENDTEIPEHHRARIVSFMNMAPNDFVDRLNRSLYKARLPGFLRTGYNVEICEELVEIQSVKYRKIILRSFKMAGGKQDVEYQSLHLFIHNKELYELTGETIEKIPETGSVKIRLGKHIEVEDSRFDATMSLDVFKNTDADE